MKRTRACSHCGGHGLVANGHGEPSECYSCEGSGIEWVWDRDPKGRFVRVEQK